MFLQVSVCPRGGGFLCRGSPCQGDPLAGRPPGRETPLARRPPSGKETSLARRPPSREDPPERRPPWGQETLREGNPLASRPPSREAPPGRRTPRRRHPPSQSMLGDTVNARAVRILLECNLVFIFNKGEMKFRTKTLPVICLSLFQVPITSLRNLLRSISSSSIRFCTLQK